MAEPYKASQNSPEAAEPQLSEKERANQANANNIRNAADVAMATKNPYAMAAGAIIKGADKLTGGKSTELLGKGMTKANKMSPGGRRIQNASNKLSESGASDAIGKAASMKSGKGAGGAAGKVAGGAGKAASGAEKAASGAEKAAGGAEKAASNAGNKKSAPKKDSKSNSSTSNSNKSNNNGLSSKIKKIIKRRIIIRLIFSIAPSLIVILPLLVIFLSANAGAEGVQELTDGEPGSNKTNATGVAYTTEEIEELLVYVGDSRTKGMELALNNQNITFIREEGIGYNWLVSDAEPELEEVLTNENKKFVVFNFGVNDFKTDSYINEYNKIIEQYPDIIFYFLSINPVDEEKEKSYNYQATTKLIEEFNEKFLATYDDKFIDSYSQIKDNFVTTDGLHYDNNTYKRIHEIVIEYIKSHNLNPGSSSTCAMTYSNGTYYLTQFPQTDDCLVEGWYDDNSWGLEPTFYATIQKLIADGSKKGCNISITSGHRTRETQQYFYNCYINKNCNNGNTAAEPGRSRHEYGIAADLQYSPHTTECVNYIHSQAESAYNYHFPVPGEDWHVEPIDISYANPS